MAIKTKVTKQRLDMELVNRGIVSSREQAVRFILSGCVKVNGVLADKRAKLIGTDAIIEVVEINSRYVSRAGEKLAAALDAFGIDCRDRIALDVGASTGGFTDCLLQRNVSQVYAIDVGYGQLDWRIRNDSRVVVLERCNMRYLDPSSISCPVDLAVIDVSFISLSLIIPKVIPLLAKEAIVVALVKPQFEANAKQVGRGGIVRDNAVRLHTIQKIKRLAEKMGLKCLGTLDSPVLGKKGNQEILLGLQWSNSLGST